MALIVIVVLGLPVSAVMTWMLSGFWDWFEKASGIESIGHSGPAEWCYWAVFSVLVFIGSTLWFLIAPRKR